MVVGPSNTVVIVGQRMEMTCQVDSGSRVRQWSIQRMDTSEKELLVSKVKNKTWINNRHFGVVVNDFGSGILYVNSTTLDDAGIYTCTVGLRQEAQPSEYRANLIVLETAPICYSNSTLPLNATTHEETRVWMRCTFNFSGNLVPVIEWRQYKNYVDEYVESRELTKLTYTEIISNSTITTELTVELSPTTDSLSYICEIYFKPIDDALETNAKNAPNYKWKILVIDISTPYLQTGPTGALKYVAASLGASLSVAAIVGCICRKRQKRALQAPTVRPAGLPDVATNQHRNPAVPLYVEAPRNEREAAHSKQGSSVSASHNAPDSRPMNYFGDDGTEYMEVNVVGRQPMSTRLPPASTMFSVVGEYASIDHTLSPPIPSRVKIA